VANPDLKWFWKMKRYGLNRSRLLNFTIGPNRLYEEFKMTQEEIIEYLKAHKDEFAKKYSISKIALFGSYARGENRPDSDIDIAIETKISDYFLLFDFKEELENFFHNRVDIVRLRDRMNESLKKHIMKDGIYV